MWLGWIAGVAAGPLATYGAGTAGDAGNAGAASQDPHAAWYNPAAMDSAKVDESAAWLFGTSQFSVDGQEVQVITPTQEDPPLGTTPTNGLMLGLVVNGYWFRVPRVNLGMTAFLPVTGAFSWTEIPEAVGDESPPPQIPRYQDQLNRLDLVLAANVWLTDQVALGAGVDFGADIETLTYVELEDVSDPDSASKAQDVAIRPTLHPYAGLFVKLGSPETVPVQLGLVGRSARQMDDYGTTYTNLAGLKVLYSHGFVRHYAPPRLTLAGAIQPVEGLSLRAEATWEGWSRAVDSLGQPLEESWRDIVTGRVGLVYQRGSWTAAAGYGFDPGAALSIPADSLIVDGPSHALNAGLGVDLFTLEEGGILSAHLGGRFRGFPSRELLDATGGAHTFSGRIWAVSVGVGLRH